MKRISDPAVELIRLFLDEQGECDMMIFKFWNNDLELAK
jgi:hypothetical protein